jgi:hypothetical protein
LKSTAVRRLNRKEGKFMKPIILALLAIYASHGDAQTLDVILVLDTTPGAEQATDRIHAKAFGDSVRVGVISAVSPVRVLQELTADKKNVADALQKAGVRIGASLGNVTMNQGQHLDLAEALAMACLELRESEGTPRKRAIIVVFAGDDRGLPPAAYRLKTALEASHAKLFAVAVTRYMTSRSTMPPKADFPFPVATAQILSDLAEMSGGRIYRQAWDIKDILKEATRP